MWDDKDDYLHENPEILPIWKVASFLDSENHQLEVEPLVISDICFPCCAPDENRNYLYLLERLKSIHFINCEFHTGSLPINAPTMQFMNCRFHKNWAHEINGRPNRLDVIFDRCDFIESVSLSGESYYSEFDDKPDGISVFRDCRINKLIAKKLSLSIDIFRNQEDHFNELAILELENCLFPHGLTLNGIAADALSIKDTRINKYFSLSLARIGTLQMQRCRFDRTADFTGAHFHSLEISDCEFSGFSNFEECSFGNRNLIPTTVGSDVTLPATTFKFTTFHKSVNFRFARFAAALDLRNSNHTSLPNFYGATFTTPAARQTDRETFRIIKNAYDAVTNHVDANKIFALEMRSYSRELRDTDRYAERFLLWCNGWMSNHGQSYVRPLSFLFLFMAVFALARKGYRDNWLYRIHEPANEGFVYISTLVNEWAAGLTIFKPLMLEGMEFVSLIFGILFSVLVWQTVTAIRRHTRR